MKYNVILSFIHFPVSMYLITEIEPHKMRNGQPTTNKIVEPIDLSITSNTNHITSSNLLIIFIILIFGDKTRFELATVPVT